VKNLLVAALRGFVSVFVNVLYDALENQQVGTPLARELDAIAVIPFDGATKDFSILKDNGHRRVGLHLLDPIKILCMGHFRWRGLFVWHWAIVGSAGRERLLNVRETRTKHTAVHHDYSFEQLGMP